MATFMAIPARTQTKTAMKKVLDYVMQKKKTDYLNPETGKRYKLVSGQNCMPETSYKEFMNTKEQYRKAHGVFYKQYVQSFKPDCGATPDQIHQKEQTKHLKDSITAALTEAERNMKKMVSDQNSDMMERLKMRDLSPVKLKIKWALIGATLPSTLLLWQLLSRLW